MTKYRVETTNGYVCPEGEGIGGRVCRVTKSTGASYFLGCCGLAGIENFGYTNTPFPWPERAEIMACLYRSLYHQGTVLYSLSQDQLQNRLHQALLEVGSQEVLVFPNLYHGPNMIHLFKVNIRNAAGRFCTKRGDAYAEPPKDDADIIPEQTGPGESGVYANIPKR